GLSRAMPRGGLSVDLDAAAERLEPEGTTLAATAELRRDGSTSGAMHGQRHLRIQAAAERVERDGPSSRVRNGQLDGATEGIHVDGSGGFPGFFANRDRSAECMRPDRSGHVVQDQGG